MPAITFHGKTRPSFEKAQTCISVFMEINSKQYDSRDYTHAYLAGMLGFEKKSMMALLNCLQ